MQEHSSEYPPVVYPDVVTTVALWPEPEPAEDVDQDNEAEKKVEDEQ